MANLENSVAQTILYLRPQTQTPATIELFDILDNAPYHFEVAPPLELVDIPLGDPLDTSSITHPSPVENALYRYGRESRESTPGLYPTSSRVIRLGFDSIDPPSPRGFEFGAGPNSNIKVPYYSKHPHEHSSKAYFRIHYNFNSGALLITALDEIVIGSTIFRGHQSLLLMAGTSIHCGNEFGFTVEFPDTSDCAEEHERNYQAYATKVGITDARYMATSQSEYPPIGAEHRSKAILGKGSFGEVHWALHRKTGQNFAIKILSGGESEMREVNIMSRLVHVS